MLSGTSGAGLALLLGLVGRLHIVSRGALLVLWRPNARRRVDRRGRCSAGSRCSGWCATFAQRSQKLREDMGLSLASDVECFSPVILRIPSCGQAPRFELVCAFGCGSKHFERRSSLVRVRLPDGAVLAARRPLVVIAICELIAGGEPSWRCIWHRFSLMCLCIYVRVCGVGRP